jgi:methionyl aminopeptidase
MISLKTARQLKLMKEAGYVAATALKLAGQAVEAGVTTGELDKLVYDYIIKQSAVPSFLNYNGYPASACISINSEVIHGIPGTRRIENGDIVSIDIGAFLNGFHSDNAATFAAGDISEQAQLLMQVTKQSLYEGINVAVQGNRIGDIGNAVQSYAEKHGFSVIKQYIGHGVGEHLHEPPDVPNYGNPGRGARLVAGMVFAIEPMINAGTDEVKTLKDGWTVVTIDGKLSAHFEHTIAITTEGPIILTVSDDL